jgi:DNA primase
MAIEQGLNVQVVLLPDNHDPDSYVREVGIEKFKDYVKNNKKDIILFKLEASLKEASDDSVKKSALINEIAETLSKIDKVEEFSKQQDYIRRCSQLLHIDEAGLIALVNKKIREKLVKRDFIDKKEVETLEQQATPEQDYHHAPINELLQKDYAQEKGLIRILLENGNKPYNEEMSIADFIRLKVGDADFEHNMWFRIYTSISGGKIFYLSRYRINTYSRD